MSIVIPCFNAVADLPGQLDALARQDTSELFEVIVSDNGSTDGLAGFIVEEAARLPYQIRRVDASQRRGVAHARNVGCAAARAQTILICDADDVVEPGWVQAMVSALATADLVGGTLVSDGINSEVVRQWRPMYRAGDLPRKLGHLGYAVGANTGLRREVFEALGGWDVGFVAGGDDVEFSWRAQHAGFTLAAAPDAVIRYRLRPSLRTTMRQSYAYARSDAQLLQAFRSAGVRRTSLRSPWWEVRWLARNVRGLVRAGSRGLWLRRAAMFAGRISGSVKYRAWAV
ncbi:glycosyltransferase family 2 protein [Kineococcus auxinigenes]|uniref:glycosyltransferase family 2 protein n=1 Tax=unclassified Kineococcus TaxID=2621656 RepID=UPI003D7D2E0A